eukprot:9482390-Pyramimonas_sp.AAC.1
MDMVPSSALRGAGPTCYSSNGTSTHIDVTIFPKCFLNVVASAWPLRRMAAELQRRTAYSMLATLGLHSHLEPAIRHGFAYPPIRWSRKHSWTLFAVAEKEQTSTESSKSTLRFDG